VSSVFQPIASDIEKSEPYETMTKKVLLYSIGASDESHGPALPRDIDDHMAHRMVTIIAERTGHYYKGHLPYCGDQVGEIARDWCASYMDSKKVITNLVDDLQHDITKQQKCLESNVSHIVIISAHGGNNFLKSQESRLSNSIMVPVLYLLPFDGIRQFHESYGELTMTHADIAEHSIAAYMNLVNESKLAMLNELAATDPEKVLRKWPALAGLGGYRLYGGPRYDLLRGSRQNSLDAAKRFLELRKMIADKDIGRKFLNASINSAIEQISLFTRISK
jgi:creatinine amidohydrolase/Fe(II)-dependent formamide hydrolase-like protein